MTSIKKIRYLACALISLLLMVSAPVSALAAADALIARNGMDGFDDNVHAICALGDTVWTYSYRSVYAYDAETGAMTEYPFTSEWMTTQQGVYQPESGKTVYRGIFAWFSWNGEVCALVSTATPNGMTGGKLCRLVIDGQGEADFEPIGAIDWQALEDDGYVQIENCCVVGWATCCA